MIDKESQKKLQQLFSKCVRYTKESELEIMSWQLANEILIYDIAADDDNHMSEEDVEKYYLIFACQKIVDDELKYRTDKSDIRDCMISLIGLLNE